MGVRVRIIKSMSVSANVISRLLQSQSWPISRAYVSAMEEFPAVYAICSDKNIPRLRGSTNLVYVGSTKCLGGVSDRTRLYSYEYPSGRHAHLIKSRCQALITDGHTLTLRWLPRKLLFEVRKLESEFLAQHLTEHLEYPPFNGKA
jgi:hypothetical protein